MKRLPAPLEIVVWPLSVLYSAVMRVRNWLYDSGILKSHSFHRPIISIGNLTAGGTGKTPLTAYLIEELLKRRKRVGVISRGYGGEVRGSEEVKVDPDADSGRKASFEAAGRYGDEPTWLALRFFKKVPVFVGRDKVKTAETLLSKHNVDLILADDAFQHRRLARSLDIVVIDASEPRWHYRSLPLGRLREGFRSLKRAQVVFLTKVNLVEDYRLTEIRQILQSYQKRFQFKIIEMESTISHFVPLNDDPGKTLKCTDLAGKKVLLVSGIGRPETFLTLVNQATGAEIADYLIYPDHHDYMGNALTTITDRQRELGVDAILMTEKDAVKLKGCLLKSPCFVSQLVSRPVSEIESFYDAVDRLAR